MTMKFRTSVALVLFTVVCLGIVRGYEDRKCHPHDLTVSDPVCSENETCVSNGTNSGICDCKTGYTRSQSSQTDCVPNPTPLVPVPASSVATMSPAQAEVVRHNSVSTGAITAAVLVPLMLATGGVLILVGRRYHWFERLQLLQGRRYEEVSIGQEDDEDDDPPLA